MSLKIQKNKKKGKMGKILKISVNHPSHLISLTTQFLELSKTLKTQILGQLDLQFSYNKWVVLKLFVKALSTIWHTRR